MKAWKTIIIAIGCALLLSVCAAVWLSDNRGEVNITNNSAERINHIEIEVCNQQFKLENIGIGESKLIRYEVKSDSHYRINVEFASGKKLEEEIGYITNGIDFKDLIVVKDTITLEQTRR